MKINKYIFLSLMGASLMLPSCKDDYLSLEPVTYLSEEDALGTVDRAQMVLESLVTSMNTPYSSMDFNGNIGEAYVNSVCNDYFGPDMTSGLWSYYITQYNWENFDSDRAYVNIIPWTYEYNLINQANIILQYIDDAEGDEAQRAFIKASALTFRAHAYQKLLGWYGQRWEDTYRDGKIGEAYCVVLRNSVSTDPLPLATHNQIFDQIYSDLDQAIELFQNTSYTRPDKWFVNGNVAAGVYARAALMKHDWENAQKYAAMAINGFGNTFTVMDSNTVLAGFTETCDDFIWNMKPTPDPTYFWSWGSHYTCNGGYVTAWQFGAGGISIDLYRQLDKNDVRRKLFLTPDKVNDLLPIIENPGMITEKDFWNPDMVDATKFLSLTKTGPFEANSKVNTGMYNVALFLCYKYKYEVFKGDLSLYEADDDFYNYYYELPSQVSGSVKLQNGKFGQLVPVPFGAQWKFWGLLPYGNLAYPWMRASEMYLVQAEAYAMMGGKDEQARAMLNQVNSKRGVTTNNTSSGEQLLEDIKVCRRIELWGEGHNFTDFKRWNVPMIRRAWVANDPTSGNFAPGFGIEKSTDACHGWRFAIPYNEKAYNPLIDTSLLNP